MIFKSVKNRIAFYIFAISILFLYPANVNSQNLECGSLFPISTETKNPPGSAFFSEHKWGYMDCNGKTIVEPEFEEVFDFNEGVGVLINGNNSTLVDLKGNKIKLKGTKILTRYSEGVAIASKKDGYFIINKKGAVVAKLPMKIENAESNAIVSHFSNGLAIVGTTDGTGFIDKSGKFVIAPRFASTNGFQDEMAAVYLEDGKSALIDTSGRYIIPPIEDDNIGIFDPSEGLAQMYSTVERTIKDRESKYYNKNGEVILKTNYDYSGSLSEGLIQIRNDEGLWGFIDVNGNEIIPPRFGDVEDFSEGLAGAEIGIAKWGFIDKTGEFVIPPIFESIESSFKNGLAYVRKDGEEGYINKNGDWVWKRKFL